MLDGQLVLSGANADRGQHEQRSTRYPLQVRALARDPGAIFVREERLTGDYRGDIGRRPRGGEHVAPQLALRAIDGRACFLNVDPCRWNGELIRADIACDSVGLGHAEFPQRRAKLAYERIERRFR